MVLGAPKELLAVGEVPAVEVISEPMFSPGSVSSAVSGGGEGEGMRRRCHRLLEGQYFGEKALFRKEVAVSALVGPDVGGRATQALQRRRHGAMKCIESAATTGCFLCHILSLCC